jgi:hypothetical protein
VTGPIDRLRQDYAAAFVGYLSRPDEAALRAAYDLGRRALADGVDLLEVVRVHHAVLADVAGRGGEEPGELADAAAGFLVEVLGSFEMTRRGFMEGRTAGARRRG